MPVDTRANQRFLASMTGADAYIGHARWAAVPEQYVGLSDRDIVPPYAGYLIYSASTSVEDEVPLSFEFKRADGRYGFIVITPQIPEPTWLVPVAEKLARILELPSDWNSYGAAPIDTNAVIQAYGVLNKIAELNTPSPAVLPTPRKGIQFEWHTKDLDLEIEVSPDGEAYFLLDDVKSEKEYEGELSSHLQLVMDAISRLSS